MNEFRGMTYIVGTLTGRKAVRVTGYFVRCLETDEIVARFHNRDYPSWREAKAAAYRLFELLAATSRA